MWGVRIVLWTWDPFEVGGSDRSVLRDSLLIAHCDCTIAQQTASQASRNSFEAGSSREEEPVTFMSGLTDDTIIVFLS